MNAPHKLSIRLATLAAIALLTAATGAQDSDDNPAQPIESCFNARGLVEFSALDDRHIYVRTRGANHYLLTTDQCDNLHRSYLRGTAGLVPFGGTVCLNDGSHVLYDSAGRQTVCPIRRIVQVSDRAQARSIAEGNPPVVVLEALPLEQP